MSTTQRELEELRQAREAARLQAEEEQRIADEKAAQKAKRDAFLAKSTFFTQRKGPTDEEIKAEVTKNSQKRRFARSLNRALSAQPAGNPLAIELGLRGKTDAQEYGEDQGRGEDTVEGDFSRPPPPPPRHLPGLGQTFTRPPPPPLLLLAALGATAAEEKAREVLESDNDEIETKEIDLDVSCGDIELDLPADLLNEEEQETQKTQKTQETQETQDNERIEWVFVCENEETPYYWNMCTNETTLDAPPAFRGPTYSEDVLKAFQEQYFRENGTFENEEDGEEDGYFGDNVIWQVCVAESDGVESVYYYNTTTDESLYERPEGTLYVTTTTKDGEDKHWQECLDNEGNVYYCCLGGDESVWERPQGTVYIVCPTAVVTSDE